MKTKELDVFILSHKMVLKIYEITKSYPEDERFGLVSQMRRSSSSIPMNIMEGGGRRNPKEFIQFLRISSGSCEEIKYQLMLSRDLKYISKEIYEECEKEYERISKMLYRLIERIKNKV